MVEDGEHGTLDVEDVDTNIDSAVVDVSTGCLEQPLWEGDIAIPASVAS